MAINLIHVFRNSKSQIYKLIRGILNLGGESYTLLVFLSADVLFLTKIIGGSAIITAIFLFFLTLILWIKLKDLIICFFLTSVFTFQLYLPNKYYIQTVFRSEQLQPGFGPYVLGYGINLENIFLGITTILIIRQLITRRGDLKKFFRSTLFIILPAFIYIICSLYSSLNYSPYTNLSVTWLVDNTQIFLTALIVYFIYSSDKKLIKLLSAPILSTIALQSVITLVQFARQSWVGLPIESLRANSVYYGAPNAVKLLFRVSGTFGVSNQFALIMVLLLIMIIPRLINQRKPIYLIASVLTITAILLTQSRSGWIALLSVIFIVAIFYKEKSLKLFNILGLSRILILSTLIIVITSIVVIPRINQSINIFSIDSSAPFRIEMIKEALIAFTQSSWIGYGIGTNEPTLLKLFPSGYIYNFPAPVHNGYLQMILESGIIGFISFIFPFVIATRSVLNNIFTKGTKELKKIKEYLFIFASGVTGIALYYLFQPYEGFREFAYLGIILGYGVICIDHFKSQKNEI